MAKKILLVEDEANIRAMYADTLKEGGYEVIQESDGMKGWEKVLEGEWDLLLLDIMLPKLDGVELLRKMHHHKETKEKPIVILTNLQDDRIKETCMSLGAKEFLVKSDIVPGDVVLAVKKYVFTE